MATREQLEAALQNPNARKYLDLLKYTEGTQTHGYATAFGGGKLGSLSAHPGTVHGFTETTGRKNKTTAAGAYQFLEGTWGPLQKKYALPDFGPHSQDIAALALVAQSGALDDVLSGNMHPAIRKTGNIWASLPTSTHPQGKKSWDKVNAFLGGKRTPSDSVAQPPAPPPATEMLGTTAKTQVPVVRDGDSFLIPTTQPEADMFGRVHQAKLPSAQETAWARAAGSIAAAQEMTQGRGSFFEDVASTQGPLDDEILNLIESV